MITIGKDNKLKFRYTENGIDICVYGKYNERIQNGNIVGFHNTHIAPNEYVLYMWMGINPDIDIDRDKLTRTVKIIGIDEI